MSEKKWLALACEFMRYAVLGGLAFVADFGTLVLTQELFLKDVSNGVYIATVFGFAVGLVVSYLLSLWFVFTQTLLHPKGIGTTHVCGEKRYEC